MDPLWIALAFVLGLAAREIGLPPLVGFLGTGFLLAALGAEGGAFLEQAANLGVTLLLFSIGLKLRIGTLLRPQVWAVTGLHMGATVLLLGAAFWLLAIAAVGPFAGLPVTTLLLIAFAASFSSTVFAVKVLEEQGEAAAAHGRIAIGILVMQDVAAVVFLALSTGKLPTPWALALLALIPARPLLLGLMNRSGHGELLILYGLLLAVGGYHVFESVQLKGDLGALLVGLLLASHPKASELSKALLSLKDLLLVGFFLSIGLRGLPDLQTLAVGTLLLLAVPLKLALFFVLMTRLHLRARTATLASLSLANFSEFGLIVGAIAAGNGWLPGPWLTALAVAVALSFVLASPLNSLGHVVYERLGRLLHRLESRYVLPEDRPVDPGDAEILIFGMGQVGTGAYDAMRQRHGRQVLGLDRDPVKVDAHREAGRNVIRDDATDPDFWVKLEPGRITTVLLAMPNLHENLLAARELAKIGFRGEVAAVARYEDEIEQLQAAGVSAFNVLAEAGVGLVEHVMRRP